MLNKTLYADTSVFGGCFDDEFAGESRQLFREIREGRFRLAISATTLLELTAAPEDVRRVLADLPPQCVEFIPLTEEVSSLRDAYLAAGVLGKGSARDAEHVASATVAGVDLVVSWNFKHIVHFEKIAGFQGVNLLRGYRPISIHSPREVIEP